MAILSNIRSGDDAAEGSGGGSGGMSLHRPKSGPTRRNNNMLSRAATLAGDAAAVAASSIAMLSSHVGRSMRASSTEGGVTEHGVSFTSQASAARLPRIGSILVTAATTSAHASASLDKEDEDHLKQHIRSAPSMRRVQIAEQPVSSDGDSPSAGMSPVLVSRLASVEFSSLPHPADG